ncbi:MAG: glycine dehydrogenase [Desulfuromonas sp. SDB]|nr:MAG: glycine dehydrogenase [Desulfuromonas sp. SDB]
MPEKLIFELPDGEENSYFCKVDGNPQDYISPQFIRNTPPLIPNVGESGVVRHFINLSTLNYHVDKNLYPLGSCTMKYNPKVNETIASDPSFTQLHPDQPTSSAQGAMRIMGELQQMLGELTGFTAVSLQPVAGAHSELTGILMFRKYHQNQGIPRSKILVPDSAHGTNPASGALAGYTIVKVKSNDQGTIDPEAVEKLMDEDSAGIMITNPNTLGLYEPKLPEICRIIHHQGGLVYMDGANLNALLGMVKPGELGVDILHFNLHKTFSTPHGGGGPGGGGVAVTEQLKSYLPVPVIYRDDFEWKFNYELKNSIGPVHSYFGNFQVMLKAYCYILRLGLNGLKRVAEQAIINANYIRTQLEGIYHLPYSRVCMHEVVFSGDIQKKRGVKTLDLAKSLLDQGYHAPTIYFPLIVSEALMIEPTETESTESLDGFIQAMKKLDELSQHNPEILTASPHKTPVGRLDEVKAARELKVRFNEQ